MSPVLLREHKATLGPYLRGLRLGSALSLREASSRLGIAFAKLQKMETGGRFRIDSVELLDDLAILYDRPIDEMRAAAGLYVWVPPSPPNAAVDRIWSYNRSTGWVVTSKFQLEPNGPPPDGEAHYETTGYGPPDMHIGSEDGVHFFVHRATHGPNLLHFEFLVWLHFGSSGFPVAVPSLPDLMVLLAKLKALTGPAYSSVVPATAGWSAGGKRVAAFAFTPEGRSIALVAGNGESEYALAEEWGAAVG